MALQLRTLLYKILTDFTLSRDKKTSQFIRVLRTVRQIREESREEFKAFADKINPMLLGLVLDIPDASSFAEVDTLLSVDGPVDDANRTLLMFAAGGGLTEIVKELIAENVNLKALDRGCSNVLDYAVASKQLAVVSSIVEAKSDPDFLNNVNMYGKTALFRAVQTHQSSIIKCLLEAKADCNVGKLPLVFILEEGRYHAESAEILYLLIRGGACVSEQYPIDQHRILCRAIDSMNASRNCSDDRVIGALVNRNLDINISDADGMTPLMAAALSAHQVVIERLIAAGATLNAITKKGKNAIDYSIMSRRPAITAMLIIAGVEILNPSAVRKQMTSWVVNCSYGPLHYCMGLTYEKEKKHKEAFAQFQKALTAGFQLALPKVVEFLKSADKYRVPTIFLPSALSTSHSALLTSSLSSSSTTTPKTDTLIDRTLVQCFIFIARYPSVKLSFQQWLFIATKASTETDCYFGVPSRRFALDAAKNSHMLAQTKEEKAAAKIILSATWCLFHSSPKEEVVNYLGDIVESYSGERDSKKAVMPYLY